jgi:hypothetical protein
VQLTFRPIDRWDRPETNPRRGSPFKATHSATLELLDRELRMLRAERVVMMVDATERDCRLDGQLRADARLASPRVILAFDSEHGPLKYACDAFDHWQENLRAIALGLEALRRVERYGIASRGEQYTGWKALGSGIAMSAAMTRAEAVAVMLDLTSVDGVAQFSEDDLDDRGTPGAFLEDAWRHGSKQWHPDLDGDGEKFYLLTRAHDVLAG